MRNPFARRDAVPPDVRARLAPGERVLASAAAEDGTWLLGTRDALLVVGPAGTGRTRWEDVESADWDREQSRLRVVEAAPFGLVRREREFTVPDPGRLLPMVRERVTASVLLQRRVPVPGGGGLTVIARRAPHGADAVTWSCELDPGTDPDDPEVRRAARTGLRAARGELGSEDDVDDDSDPW